MQERPSFPFAEMMAAPLSASGGPLLHNLHRLRQYPQISNLIVFTDELFQPRAAEQGLYIRHIIVGDIQYPQLRHGSDELQILKLIASELQFLQTGEMAQELIGSRSKIRLFSLILYVHIVNFKAVQAQYLQIRIHRKCPILT